MDQLVHHKAAHGRTPWQREELSGREIISMLANSHQASSFVSTGKVEWLTNSTREAIIDRLEIQYEHY